MSRILRKFGYDITENRILEIEKKYLSTLLHVENELTVSINDWNDFIFTVRYKTNFYIERLDNDNNDISLNLVELREGMLFQVIKSTTKKDHPWLHQNVFSEEILEYYPSNVYGSINRYQGLPMKIDDSICQINYSHIKFFK